MSLDQRLGAEPWRRRKPRAGDQRTDCTPRPESTSYGDDRDEGPQGTLRQDRQQRAQACCAATRRHPARSGWRAPCATLMGFLGKLPDEIARKQYDDAGSTPRKMRLKHRPCIICAPSMGRVMASHKGRERDDHEPRPSLDQNHLRRDAEVLRRAAPASFWSRRGEAQQRRQTEGIDADPEQTSNACTRTRARPGRKRSRRFARMRRAGAISAMAGARSYRSPVRERRAQGPRR